MDPAVSKYLATIGRRGGAKSRRTLDPATARRMVQLREARRAFTKYRAACFWSYAPNFVITADDIGWVATQLKKHGDRGAWEIGARLCR